MARVVQEVSRLEEIPNLWKSLKKTSARMLRTAAETSKNIAKIYR